MGKGYRQGRLGEEIRTVSYTHLDVYKRQIIVRIQIKLKLQLFLPRKRINMAQLRREILRI